MLKKTLIMLFIVIFCVIGYFAFTIFAKREKDIISSSNTPQTQNDARDTFNENGTHSSNAPQENIIENLIDESSQANNTAENGNSTTITKENIYINITPPDCMRECEPYKYDEKELEYCQNVCGLPSQSSQNTSCDSLSDLQKDYCYKNQAIDKKDMSICDPISDSKIKKTCTMRIQEDILEEM